MNAHHREPVKARHGYISIYECGKTIFHSMYGHVCTSTDYIKKVPTNLIEELEKYKLDFEDLRNRIVEFKEPKMRAENITVDSVSIHPQVRQSGNDVKEKDNS